MEVEKLFFQVGVYDSTAYDEWPWYFANEGVYLSPKGRFCNCYRALSFLERSQAVQAFHEWHSAKPSRSKYRLHIVEAVKWVEDESVKPYLDDHPFAEVESSGLSRCYKTTAFFYFYGQPLNIYSKATYARHRKLLKDRFGFDIFEPLPEDLLLRPVKVTLDDPFSKPPELVIAPPQKSF